jgi:uncharacterized protein YegL
MSKTTHIICILDRSGSMSTVAEEVRSNFNHFLKEQQELEGKAKLTLVLFDDRYKLIYDEVDLQKAKPLTSEQYYARGMTAMNDAIGRTLTNKARKQKAIVFIHTDGHENDSKEYSNKDVKKLVKKLEKKWEFIFVGAGIDAMAANKDYGFRHTLNAKKTSRSFDNQYDMFGAATSCYRATGVAGSVQTMNIVAEANANEIEDSAGGILDQLGNTITTTTTITSE